MNSLLSLVPSSLREIIRFSIAGLIATAAYAIFTAAFVIGFTADPVRASVAGYACAILVSYLLQNYFAFRYRKIDAYSISRFVLVSLSGMTASYFFMKATVEVLEWGYLSGIIIVCILIPLFNYFALKLFVFVKK